MNGIQSEEVVVGIKYIIFVMLVHMCKTQGPRATFGLVYNFFRPARSFLYRSIIIVINGPAM